MEAINDASLFLFLLSVAIVVGWAGIPSGYKWKDGPAFIEAVATGKGARPLNWLRAVLRFRPDLLAGTCLVVAVLLKTAYEIWK